MSGGQNDDVGAEYLETQQALGQIRCENRPMLFTFMPFSCFRQLPSAPVCFRQLPPSSVGVRFRSAPACLGDGNMSAGLDDVGRAYLKTQQALGEIFGENRPILGLFRPIFRFRQLPSASVSFRHLPEPPVVFRV